MRQHHHFEIFQESGPFIKNFCEILASSSSKKKIQARCLEKLTINYYFLKHSIKPRKTTEKMDEIQMKNCFELQEAENEFAHYYISQQKNHN